MVIQLLFLDDCVITKYFKGVDNTSAPTYKVADRDGSAGVRIAAYDSYRVR